MNIHGIHQDFFNVLLPMIALLVLIHFDAFDLHSLMVISFAVSSWLVSAGLPNKQVNNFQTTTAETACKIELPKYFRQSTQQPSMILPWDFSESFPSLKHLFILICLVSSLLTAAIMNYPGVHTLDAQASQKRRNSELTRRKIRNKGRIILEEALQCQPDQFLSRMGSERRILV
jgi:hypothetical protein